MRATWAMAAIAGLMAGTPALAQEVDPLDDQMEAIAPESADDSFACSFAGECPVDESLIAVPTKDAPETRGFRIASGLSQPMQSAPSTRGFRIARTAGAVALPPVGPRRSRLTTESSRRFATVPQVAAPGAPRTDLLLTFSYNSTSLTKAAEGRARGFAQALMMPELKDKRFVIEGHTDARGKREKNIDLSRRRAQAVADFLVAQGVDRNRVTVKGVGPDEPLPGLAINADVNRRVEAVLLS